MSLTRKGRTAKSQAGKADRLSVGAEALGMMLGVSERTIWTRNAAGEIPRPRKFGGLTMWSVSEVRAWEEAGMPDRTTWERIQAARSG